MKFSKTNFSTLPYISMAVILVLFNIAFTIAYINIKEKFLLIIYLIDVIFFYYYNPFVKIHITEDSIIQKGFFINKQVYFHQIKQLSFVRVQRSDKFIKADEIPHPSLAIYQICVSKIRLSDPPASDPNISGKDYIQFDYRPEALKELLNHIT